MDSGTMVSSARVYFAISTSALDNTGSRIATVETSVVKAPVEQWGGDGGQDLNVYYSTSFLCAKNLMLFKVE